MHYCCTWWLWEELVKWKLNRIVHQNHLGMFTLRRAKLMMYSLYWIWLPRLQLRFPKLTWTMSTLQEPVMELLWLISYWSTLELIDLSKGMKIFKHPHCASFSHLEHSPWCHPWLDLSTTMISSGSSPPVQLQEVRTTLTLPWILLSLQTLRYTQDKIYVFYLFNASMPIFMVPMMEPLNMMDKILVLLSSVEQRSYLPNCEFMIKLRSSSNLYNHM